MYPLYYIAITLSSDISKDFKTLPAYYRTGAVIDIRPQVCYDLPAASWAAV
jgi:hypothetical protein